MQPKFYRSKSQRMLAGVCGGLAEYFNVDVTLVRVLWLLTVLLHGAGFLAYIICWIIVPDNPVQAIPPKRKPDGRATGFPGPEETGTEPATTGVAAEDHGTSATDWEADQEVDHEHRRRTAGVALIILGLILFSSRYFPAIPWRSLWPLVLVAVGAALIWQNRHKGGQD